MNLKEFRDRTNGMSEDTEVCIRVDKGNSVGGTPTVAIGNLSIGIDWDSGKLILNPSKRLSESYTKYCRVYMQKLVWVSDNGLWTVVFESDRNGVISKNNGINTREFSITSNGDIQIRRGNTKYSIKSIPVYVMNKIKRIVKALGNDLTMLDFWGIGDQGEKLSNTIYTISDVNADKKYRIDIKKGSKI